MDLKPIKKVMVGVPINRPIEFFCFESFVKLANRNSDIELAFCMTQNSLVYDARETIAQKFLESEADALMFIDSDMTFHSASIEYLARHNKPFVTAKAFKRVHPYQPCFYSKLEPAENGEWYMESPVEYGEGLLRIEGAGMACALIRREAFEAIDPPYFFPKVGLGEDLSFCLKLKDAGVEMFLDTTIQFGHLAQVAIMESHFKEVYEANKHNAKKLYVD